LARNWIRCGSSITATGSGPEQQQAQQQQAGQGGGPAGCGLAGAALDGCWGPAASRTQPLPGISCGGLTSRATTALRDFAEPMTRCKQQYGRRWPGATASANARTLDAICTPVYALHHKIKYGKASTSRIYGINAMGEFECLIMPMIKRSLRSCLSSSLRRETSRRSSLSGTRGRAYLPIRCALALAAATVCVHVTATASAHVTGHAQKPSSCPSLGRLSLGSVPSLGGWISTEQPFTRK